MIVRLALHAMATRFELALEARDEARGRAVGEAALEELAEAERRWSRFDPASLLSRVNRGAAGRPVVVDADTLALLATCARVHRASGGAFDPTVAPLMAAGGVGSPGAPRPSAAAARARVGFDAVHLDPARGAVRFARAGVELDLGGVAKGAALDLAAAVLREHGVARALLHGGTSTAVALGAPAGAAGFRVALRGAPRVAVLRDAALSVSGAHGRALTLDGRRGGHVLDPRTGRPAAARRLAAVALPAAADADAWSTALLAGAPLAALPADAVALVVDAAGALHEHRGPRARAGLRFEVPDVPHAAPRAATPA